MLVLTAATVHDFITPFKFWAFHKLKWQMRAHVLSIFSYNMHVITYSFAKFVTKGRAFQNNSLALLNMKDKKR